jgi:U3 small nucleolar RNA-associated protein 20
MAPISPGRPAGPPRKAKKPTATTKTFRYEPFTKRIARLKIDPVHRLEKYRPIDDDIGLSQSYFRTAFEHWADLNQSETYRQFSRQVRPKCESLPQLLHHADAICELLVKGIGKKDENALEPLLSLIEAFAHDLGGKFEKYFAEVVTLVLHVAASHGTADVIEWCFKCITWTFRFLSRLLVPDLRPLLAILLPYLGAEKQKHYITRFAAESLAFLLRKTAVKFAAQPQYLLAAVDFLLHESQERVDQEGKNGAYQVGVMTLFSEAAMGVDGNVHSSAPALISGIIQCVLASEPTFELGLGILEGTIISLIHQTGAVGFESIFNMIESTAVHASSDDSDFHVRLYARLLHVMVGTRMGTRILDWSKAATVVLHISSVGATTFARWENQLMEHLTTIAMVMQYAPMDQLLPRVQQLLQAAQKLSNSSQFFSFCEIFASLGTERYNSLMLPHYQVYVLSHWRHDEAGLLLLLRGLRSYGIPSHANTKISSTLCPAHWESRILQLCQNCAKKPIEEFDFKIDCYMQLSDVLKFPKDETAERELEVILHALTDYGLQNGDVVASTKARFALGRGFQTYLRLSQSSAKLDNSLWGLICKLPAQTFGLQPFLHGLRWYAGQTLSSRPLERHEEDHIRNCLFRNLSTDVVSLKLLSVQLMKEIFSKEEQWLELAIKLMIDVLETPYALKNERDIAAQLREFPRLQRKCPSKISWGRLFPTFCMGLMPHYHATPLRELCSAIREMCFEQEVEEYVIDTCTKWLQTVEEAPLLPTEVDSQVPELQYPSFQCSNVLSVDHMTEKTLKNYSKADELLAAGFLKDHQIYLVSVPSSSRHLALELLSNIPQLAEKRSRLLVPIFLTAHVTKKQLTTPPEVAGSVSSHTLSPELSEQAWSYTDRRLFLELFGKFINPGVLYRSGEVHEAMLELLTNGSSEIQKAALKALFTWKDPSVQPYEDALLSILDGTADSNELDLLLHPESDKSSIEVEHRAGLMPILLRLIFGLMINQSKSKGPQEGKRKAMLRKMFNLSVEEIHMFLRISFGPLARLSTTETSEGPGYPLDSDLIPTDQQYGFLRTMQTMLSVLKTQMSPFGNQVFPPIFYCLARACRQINEIACQVEDHPRQSASSLVRNVRRSGLECIALVFEYCDDLAWFTSMPLMFAEVIKPRLPTLAIDTAQGISGLLRLFSIWSKSENTIAVLQQEPQLMLSVISCIGVPSAKDEVKLFALNDIVLNVARLAESNNNVNSDAVSIIQDNIGPLLANLNSVLQAGPSQIVLEAVVNVLPMLAPFAKSSSEAQALLSSLAAVLGKNHRLNPRIKGGLLRAVQSLLQDHYERIDVDSRNQVYELTCSLFNYFKDDANRATLCSIIGIFAHFDDQLIPIFKICRELNKHGGLIPVPRDIDADQGTVQPKKSKHSRLDEGDYDQQIGAFTAINELEMRFMTAQSWKPILHNLLYFTRTEDDFTIRSNAVACIRHFIVEASVDEGADVNTLMQDTLLPAFEKGMRELSETTRADFVALLGVLVQHLHNAPEIQDMKVLLVGGDAEASFYANILHIQQHRRLRAMRRLVTDTEDGALQDKNISRYFLPLLERFVFDSSEDENTLTLKGQAIVAISSMLKWVEWTGFRATFRRYRGLMDSKVLKDKDVMKLLNGAVDALTSAQAQKQSTPADLSSSTCPLSSTLPSEIMIANELKTQFIPKLTEYIKHNDETQASLRLPASVVAIKAILMLPPAEGAFMIPGILLDVCNILRSRDQQIRDDARTTLADVSLILGPRYLHLVVKELRTALNRGYQVHVLTYTMHKIVMTMVPQLQPGDLDYCLSELTSLLMDDIFGAAGIEKDNDDYVSSMKEVKGNKKHSKSFGIIEALAGVTSVKKVSALLEPLRLLLTGTLSSKQQQHADEVLRRIGVGLAQNYAAGSRDMLMLSYELIKDLYKEKEFVAPRAATTADNNRKRYLVQGTSNHKSSSGVNSPGLYKIHRFALDLLRSNLQRHQELLTVENLHGFLSVIGDTIIGQQDDVKTSGFRLLSAIIKLPLHELSENAALYVKEAVQVVENASNTNADGPQAALKFVASVLREKPAVEVRRRDLEYLLHKIIPDLEEPDRQGSSFNLVRAVMSREVKSQTFELPEMYEMADKISVMMVSNHSQSARDIARGIYVHFLLEYPQTKKRWEKQLKFLAENLEYQYPEGRQSIMEAINVLITKLNAERAQEPISWFFLPVVLRLANDETEKCRDMAGALLERLFSKASKAEMEKMLQSMRGWIGQIDEQALTTTGMQAYGHFLQVVGPEKEAVHVRTSIEEVLLADAASMLIDNHLRSQAVELFSKLVAAAPAATMTQKQAALWCAIQALLPNHDIEMRSTAASLISLWFQDIVTANSKPELKLQKLPLRGSHGLQLDKTTMIELLKSSLRTLRRLDGSSPTLGPATVRNVLFLARCFDANEAEIDIRKGSISGSDSESNAESSEESDSDQPKRKIKTPAVQYLLHQLSAILRRESDGLISAALAAKTSTLQLLLALLPSLSPLAFTHPNTLPTLLTPLRHLTATDFIIPKSADPTFESTYTSLISFAHEAIDALHASVGDAAYIAAMTRVGREVRDRREERRAKRRITQVVDPERAAGKRVRKNERKSSRKKEVSGVHRLRRSLV